ncbi:MAG: hypothetical protein PHH26_01705 [Candidatus Thermoplasmatota archaeon]|nr:hypothetical protein [Candidatus Thermoplasmatota archaeon]
MASISGGSVPTSWEGWPIDGANYFSMQHAFREHEYFAQLVNALNERAAAVHEVWPNTDYSVKIIKTGMVGEAGDEREVGFTNQFGEIDCGGGDTAYFEVTRDDMIDLITGIVSLFEGVQWVRHDLSDDGRWGVLDYWFDGYTKKDDLDLYHWPYESLRTALAVLEIGYDVGLLWFWEDEPIYTTGGVVYVMSQPDTASPIEWTLAEKQSWSPGYIASGFTGVGYYHWEYYNKLYVPNTMGRELPLNIYGGSTGPVFVSTEPVLYDSYAFLFMADGNGTLPAGTITLYEDDRIGNPLINYDNAWISGRWYAPGYSTNIMPGHTTNNTTPVWREDTHVVGTFAHKALPGSVPKIKAKPSFFGNVTLHGTVWTNSPEDDGFHAVFFGSEETVSVGGTEENCTKYWYSVTNIVVTADPPNDTTTVYVAWDYSGAFYSQMLGYNDYLTGLHWPDVLNDAQKVIDRMRWFVGKEGEWFNARKSTNTTIFPDSDDLFGVPEGVTPIDPYNAPFTFPTNDDSAAIAQLIEMEVMMMWAPMAIWTGFEPPEEDLPIELPLWTYDDLAEYGVMWKYHEPNDPLYSTPPSFRWRFSIDAVLEGVKYWYVLPEGDIPWSEVESFNVTGYWSRVTAAQSELEIWKSDYRVRAPTNSHVELYGYSYLGYNYPPYEPADTRATSTIHALYIDTSSGTGSVREFYDISVSNLGSWVDGSTTCYPSISTNNTFPHYNVSPAHEGIALTNGGWFSLGVSAADGGPGYNPAPWELIEDYGQGVTGASEIVYDDRWFYDLYCTTSSYMDKPIAGTIPNWEWYTISAGSSSGKSSIAAVFDYGTNSYTTLWMIPLIKLDVSGGLKYVD